MPIWWIDLIMYVLKTFTTTSLCIFLNTVSTMLTQKVLFPQVHVALQIIVQNYVFAEMSYLERRLVFELLFVHINERRC